MSLSLLRKGWNSREKAFYCKSGVVSIHTDIWEMFTTVHFHPFAHPPSVGMLHLIVIGGLLFCTKIFHPEMREIIEQLTKNFGSK